MIEEFTWTAKTKNGGITCKARRTFPDEDLARRALRNHFDQHKACKGQRGIVSRIKAAS